MAMCPLSSVLSVGMKNAVSAKFSRTFTSGMASSPYSAEPPTSATEMPLSRFAPITAEDSSAARLRSFAIAEAIVTLLLNFMLLRKLFTSTFDLVLYAFGME